MKLVLISVLLLYRGALALDDPKAEAVTDKSEAEDRQEDEAAVQSEDEGRASLTYQTGAAQTASALGNMGLLLGGLYALSGFLGSPSKLARSDPLGLSKRLGEAYLPDLASPYRPYVPSSKHQKPLERLDTTAGQRPSFVDARPPRRSSDVYNEFLPSSPSALVRPGSADRPSFEAFRADLRPLTPQRQLSQLHNQHQSFPARFGLPNSNFNHKSGETEGLKGKAKKSAKSSKAQQYPLPAFFDDRQLQVAAPVPPPPPPSQSRPRPSFPGLPTFNLRRPALGALGGLFRGRPSSAPLRLAEQQQLPLEQAAVQQVNAAAAPARPGTNVARPPPVVQPAAVRPPAPQQPAAVRPEPAVAAAPASSPAQTRPPVATTPRPSRQTTRSTQAAAAPTTTTARQQRPLPPVENSSFRDQAAPLIPSNPAAAFGNAFAGTSGDPFNEFRTASFGDSNSLREILDEQFSNSFAFDKIKRRSD